MSAVLVIAASVLLGGLGSLLAMRSPEFACWWYGAVTLFCAGAAVLNAFQREWGWAAWTAVCTAANFWWWLTYRNRRRRRRALAALGAKARARIAAMTARMRERPARPVLRPVPAGAR